MASIYQNWKAPSVIEVEVQKAPGEMYPWKSRIDRLPHELDYIKRN